MSRTRHATAELDALANAFRHAEEVSSEYSYFYMIHTHHFPFYAFSFQVCPGICNELVEEILTRLAHPQVNQGDLGRAVKRLTT